MAIERRARAPLHPVLPFGLVFGVVLTFAQTVHATEPSIWYRAGEGCPDGASFLERLERRGVRARLAAVGDQVDFVVTLGDSGSTSSGRLERQTSRGTIAIRQVEDARCEAVADVLALTLVLTNEPASEPAAGAAEVVAPVPAASTKEPAPSEQAAVSAAPPAPVVAAAPARATRAPAEPSETSGRRAALALGAELSAWDAFSGPWLFGLGPFAEVRAPAAFPLPRASARAVLRGGLRFDDGDADVGLWLGAGRLEGCPVGFATGALELRPCLAIDLGVLGASAAGVSDTAFWSAGAAHARLTLRLDSVAVEAQAGLIAPFTRYEVASESAVTLEKTRIIGFATGLGASFDLE